MRALTLLGLLAGLDTLPLKQKDMLLLELIVPLTPYRGFHPRS